MGNSSECKFFVSLRETEIFSVPTNFIADIRITSGEQFQVQIGDENRSGDLYYLGIDPRNEDHNCSADLGLWRLITGWIDTIAANTDGQRFYLPFDFSDEFTRWVACEKSGNEITVVFGWAEVEGWSFSPSEFSAHSQDLKGFRADEPTNPQTFYTPQFLSDLRRSRALITLDA